MKTEGEIQKIIENAGKYLALYPSYNLYPKKYKSLWPDIKREYLDTLEIVVGEDGKKTLSRIYPDERPFRATLTAQQVTEMDTALQWMSGLAVYCKKRQIPHVAKAVGYRMIHHPDGRRKYSWQKIAEKFPSKPSYETVRKWHKDGIRILTDAENISNLI